MRWSALLFLAGCGFSGAAASDDDGPTDAVIADAAVDAEDDAGDQIDGPSPPVDAGPDLDQDDDTILDVDDNCPATANTDQWNEDGDAFGDPCDLCPHLPALQQDADGDLVGNGCDPRPNTAGDELVLFEGFNTPSNDAPTGWAMGGDDHWSVSGGALRYATTNDAEGAVSIAPQGGLGSQHAVQAGGRISLVTSGEAQVFGLITDFNLGVSERYFHCAISADRDELELFSYDSAEQPSWTRIDTETLTVVTGTLYRLVSIAGPTSQACRNNTLVASGTKPSYQGTRVGLRVRNATAEIEYIAVYRVP